MASLTESFRCDQCACEYSCKSNLNRHVKTVHSGVPVLTEKCLFCSMGFATLSQLQQHASKCQPPELPPVVPLGPSQPPLLLPTTEQAEAVADFIKWLGEPCLNVTSLTVKRKRKVDEADVKIDRANVNFLLAKAAMNSPPGTVVDLKTLAQADMVTVIMEQMEAKVQSERMYQLAWQLHKVCVYLCERQSRSTKLYITPDHLSGWPVITQFEHKHCVKKKLIQRDNSVLHGDELSKKSMTPQELDTVVQKTEIELTRLEAEWVIPTPSHIEQRYVAFFLTANLALLFAPRQQVLRELSTDTVFPPQSPGNSSDQFVIKVSSVHSKVKQPVLLRVPDSMTAHWKFYYRFILGAAYTGPLFRQRGGGRRQDFTVLTKDVTDELLGRGITAHKFRHAVATSFHLNPSTSAEDMKMLAMTMNHSQQVQQNHYVYHDRLASQARAQNEWDQRLGITPQKRPREQEEEKKEEE